MVARVCERRFEPLPSSGVDQDVDGFTLVKSSRMQIFLLLLIADVALIIRLSTPINRTHPAPC